jgi:pimeloyl-ACP methyl ester carboxylesterase
MVVVLATAGPAVLLAPVTPDWTPEFLAHWTYDVRLFLARPAKSVLALVHGSPSDWQILHSRSGRSVRAIGPEVDLAATLYVPDRPAPVPGILLLHGSTPAGRELGLYRVLADELCARGYAVLAPDQRGYGESPDPPRPDRATAFDYVGDARRALDYLARVEGVDASRLHVVGHSFGADVALSVGLTEPRVLKIVAFAPTRGLIERAGTRNAPQTGYYVRREMRYMELPSPIAQEVFFAYRLPLILDAHLDALSRPGHRPLLLIEGDREPIQQRDYLARLYDRIAEPKAHLTLHLADHYANVADLGPLTIYSQRTMNELTNAIDDFLSP